MPEQTAPYPVSEDSEFETLTGLLHAYRTPVVIILFGILISLGLFFATLVGQTSSKEDAFRNYADTRFVELDAGFDILFAELNQLDAVIEAGLSPDAAVTIVRRSGAITQIPTLVDIGIVGPETIGDGGAGHAAAIASALAQQDRWPDAATIRVLPLEQAEGEALIFAAIRPMGADPLHHAFIIADFNAMLSHTELQDEPARVMVRFGEAPPVFVGAERPAPGDFEQTAPYLIHWNAPSPFQSFQVSLAPTRDYLLRLGLLPWLVLAFSLFATASIGALALMDARRSELVRREVDRKTAALKASNEVIAAKNEELARFAAHASHDLQAPLRAMKSLATLLVERDLQLDERSEDMLNRINRGADRAQRLVQDLLSYTQAEKAQLSPEAISLDEIREEIEDLLGETAREAGAEIVWQGDSPVHADRFLLSRAVQNLVSNAIKYRGERPPRILVETRSVGSATRLSVTDNGIGIDEAYFERIFDIFERLHSSDTYSGSGIGLAMCKRVADMHDAQIGLTSEPGEGSCFYIIFPDRDGSRAIDGMALGRND